MKEKTHQKGSAARTVFLVLLSIYLLVPFAVTLIYSLFVDWTGLLPHGFTLRNYQQLFADTEFWGCIGRTLLICLISVAVTVVLVLLAMYVVVVINPKLEGATQMICMIPYALQGVILSISIISLYSGSNTILSNRMFMLYGAYTILVLPYIYQGIRNSLRSVNARALIQAAQVLGCSRFRAYVTVVLPNIGHGILVSCLLAESIVFGDFVLAKNIAGNSYENIQVFLNRKMFKSSGLSSAIVVIIFLVVFLLTGAVLKMQGNTGTKEKKSGRRHNGLH